MATDCSSCAQMKAENKQLRKYNDDTNRNYIQVCNENLALRKRLVQSGVYFHDALHEEPNA